MSEKHNFIPKARNAPVLGISPTLDSMPGLGVLARFARLDRSLPRCPSLSRFVRICPEKSWMSGMWLMSDLSGMSVKSDMPDLSDMSDKSDMGLMSD